MKRTLRNAPCPLPAPRPNPGSRRASVCRRPGRKAFCRHFVACGPDRSAPPDRTEPHMTYHDILHTPLPVIPTGRQRAEGTRLDPDDGIPPLRLRSGQAVPIAPVGMTGASGAGRRAAFGKLCSRRRNPGRGAGRKMADFRRKWGSEMALSRKKNALYRPVCLVTDRMAGRDTTGRIMTFPDTPHGIAPSGTLSSAVPRRSHYLS